MDLKLIGGCLSLFGAIILLTILAAQMIRRKSIEPGPIRECFCLLLTVGVVQVLLYGWAALHGSQDAIDRLAFMLAITWSVCLGIGLLCRFLCLVIEYSRTERGSWLQKESDVRKRSALENRAGRKVLVCQYAACAMGGLISSIGLITGQIWRSMILIIIVGIAVFLSCWVLLIKHRRLIGTGYTVSLMILLPLSLAACIFQWASGGIPMVSMVITLRLLILYILIQNGQAQLMAEIRRADERLRLQMIARRMKPHFLYNSLTSIYYLCEQDPGLAQKAIEAFSSYLRDTMDSFESEDLVPFSWERKQVDHYMFLEKLRFGDQIDLQYDLGIENFRLPPLSVQFLVENAIKHGRDREHPAVRIRITTAREKGWIRLCVSDNGRGFDPAKAGEDGETHLGLVTVEERIRLLCGGSMSVESRPGEGTTVTLEIKEY